MVSQIAPILRRAVEGDAVRLFPLVNGTAVVDTIQWDGPESYEAFAERLQEHVLNGRVDADHFFVIVDEASNPIGCCDVRPDAERFRGVIGLWIGLPFQGRGFGTRVVAALSCYAFDQLGLTKVEAHVFVGNSASRRIFEKNGYELEGTIRAACLKRGKPVDEWYLGKLTSRL